jgi:hypothetical protein
MIALAMTFRVLSLRPAELAYALARPLACACVVAVTLLATLSATDTLGSLAALGAVAVAATISFLFAVAILGRPLMTPIWSALRRT